MTGCIATKDEHYLVFVPGHTITWKKAKTCTPENYVKILENGIFQDFKTHRCITLRDLSRNKNGKVIDSLIVWPLFWLSCMHLALQCSLTF